MYIEVDKNKMKASVLSIVERFIEESYDEEEIRKLTLAKYAELLVKASEDVINRFVEESGEDKLKIDREKLGKIVQSEVDKLYK